MKQDVSQKTNEVKWLRLRLEETNQRILELHDEEKQAVRDLGVVVANDGDVTAARAALKEIREELEDLHAAVPALAAKVRRAENDEVQAKVLDLQHRIQLHLTLRRDLSKTLQEEMDHVVELVQEHLRLGQVMREIQQEMKALGVGGDQPYLGSEDLIRIFLVDSIRPLINFPLPSDASLKGSLADEDDRIFKRLFPRAD